MDTSSLNLVSEVLTNLLSKQEKLLLNAKRYAEEISEVVTRFKWYGLERINSKKYDFLMAFVKKLGNPFSILRLPLRKIRQYINRFLFILLQEEYSQSSEKKSDIFNTVAFKQQNFISPNISYITTRNFSIQKNLSISA